MTLLDLSEPVTWYLVSFFIFVGFAVYTLRRPIQGYIEKRRHSVRYELEQAEQQLEQMQAQLAEAQKRHEDTQETITRIHERADVEVKHYEELVDAEIEDFKKQQEALYTDAVHSLKKRAEEHLKSQVVAGVMAHLYQQGQQLHQDKSQLQQLTSKAVKALGELDRPANT